MAKTRGRQNGSKDKGDEKRINLRSERGKERVEQQVKGGKVREWEKTK